jgi:hypothetical protein
MKSDQELYRGLRVLSCEKLWNDEVARFERSTPGERIKRVAVIRAVGAVFSKSGAVNAVTLIRLLRSSEGKTLCHDGSAKSWRR